MFGSLNGLSRYESRWLVATVVATAVFYGLALRWLLLDQSPPRWDESVYLVQSTALHQGLREHGFLEFVRLVFNYDPGRVPLLALVVLPSFWILGPSADAAVLTANLAWIVVAWSLYGLTKCLGGPSAIAASRGGFFSVILFGLYPLTTFLSSNYLVELLLVSFICAAYYSMLRFYATKMQKWLMACGIFLGLGMLTKVTFLAFVLPAILLLFAQDVHDRGIKKATSGVGLILVVMSVLAGPYYLYNFKSIVGTTLFLSSEHLASLYGFGKVMDITTILIYWRDLFLVPVLVISAAGSILIMASSRIRANLSLRKDLPDNKDWTTELGFRMLILWFAVPFVLATFGSIKDPRYIYPGLVPLFILGGIAISWLWERRAGAIAVVLIYAIPIGQYMVGNGLGNHRLTEIVSARATNPPDPRDWHASELVVRMGEVLDQRGVCKNVFFLGGNRYYHVNLLRYWGMINKQDIRYDVLPYYLAPEMNLTDALQYIARTAPGSIIVKSGPHWPEFSSRLDSGIIAKLKSSGVFEAVDLGIEQPDGSRFTLFVRTVASVKLAADDGVKREPEGGRELLPTSVSFGRHYRLLSAILSEQEEGARLTLQWKSLSRQRHLHVNFVHFLDGDGKIVGNLDRSMDCARGIVAEGEIWKDEIIIPREKAPTVAALGLGWYVPPSASSALTVENGVVDWEGRRLLLRIR